ncbi:MAG: ABC transporter substrate-binding protein [Anaerolineae bacterium]|nr:ABC transporter substrate-binding protein [Anaerolineae bacterium]MDW8069612.1 ABC transporter substrate-binding protein [Anaerolineae bacterium]
MKRCTIVLLSVFLLLLLACSRPNENIRLPMGYIANVQFAPWYVAVERGYFAAEGMQLAFDYSWETDGVRLVGAGELPFAIASGDQVILARSQGIPVVTVASWWQRFPVAVVALEESGIRTPADLKGRKVGIPETFGASYIGWRALLAATGLKEEDVTLEVIGYTQVASLVEKRVDAAVVYANNEPVQLTQAGYRVVLIPVADYAPLVSNGIITNEKMIQERPEQVRRFVRAFLRGLRDTLKDPDGAFEACRKYVEGLDQNEAVQRAVLEATLPLWQREPLGWSDPAAWQATVQAMQDAGLLTGPVDGEKAFTNEFLP